MGSPPQVRGKRNRKRPNRAINRITPAGAGKTRIMPTVLNSDWDHPRRCGENYEQLVGGVETLGSPPQVRGKPRVSVTRGAKPGITPAGAGKTTCIRFLWAGGWDHPRRCGENAIRETRKAENPGSPPQVRGKRPVLST